MESPFSGVGNLREEVEQKLSGKADKYEVNSLHSKISSLENTIREIRSQNDGLCIRVQELEDSIQRLTQA